MMNAEQRKLIEEALRGWDPHDSQVIDALRALLAERDELASKLDEALKHSLRLASSNASLKEINRGLLAAPDFSAERDALAERVRVLEIERLQKDATRYQWLKATPLTLTPKYMKDFSTVDEAIDAAIAGKLPNHA